MSKLWSGIYRIKSIICISQIPRYASYATYLLVMCRSQYPPNFSEKENGKDQNSVSCTKKISYFWFPQGMIIFLEGVRQKRNFRRGGGVGFGSQFLENQEGRGVIGKIPSVGGGMDIFWNYTITYMKKLLDSDWLRKECKNVQHKCKKVQH